MTSPARTTGDHAVMRERVRRAVQQFVDKESAPATAATATGAMDEETPNVHPGYSHTHNRG